MSDVPRGGALLDPERLHPEAQRLKEYLENLIVGQEMAIDRTVKNYNNSFSPIRISRKPISVSLWPGPTGVGKTEMAKEFGRFLFDTDEGITRIDCGGLMEKHKMEAAVLGSPPGYIGFWDPNDAKNTGSPPPLAQVTIERPARMQFEARLFKTDRDYRRLWLKLEDFKGEPKNDQKKWKEKVAAARQEIREYVALRIAESRHLFQSVILFDEIERAHPELQNILFTIIGEGHAQLSNGMVTDFRNSHVIATSNLAEDKIAALLQGKVGMGFTSSQPLVHKPKDLKSKPIDPIYEAVKGELKKWCKAPFLGRIRDGIVVFRPLSKDSLREIFERKIALLHHDLAQNFPIELVITQKVRTFVFEEATDHPEDGARLVEDKLKHYIRDPVGRMITSRQVEVGDRVIADKDERGIVFRKERVPKIIVPITPSDR